MRGNFPISYPSRGAIDCKTNGLKNPIKTDAEVCIPIVSVNISTDKPRKNERNKTSQAGVSNGSNNIKSIYK